MLLTITSDETGGTVGNRSGDEVNEISPHMETLKDKFGFKVYRSDLFNLLSSQNGLGD